MHQAEATVEETVEETVSTIERGELHAPGAISSRSKLPWSYRRPDAVLDDLLARLLALNAEHYAQEVAMGLHNNAGIQAAKASGGGKRRGRTNKGSQE